MLSDQELLVASIEEMIIRASRRLVDLGSVVDGDRIKSSIEHLARFRASLMSERAPGTTLPALPDARKRRQRRQKPSKTESLEPASRRSSSLSE